MVKTTEDLEERFGNLCLISKLEALNLPYHSVQSLQACDKLSLIESVLRSCGHRPEGIALVVGKDSYKMSMITIFGHKHFSKVIRILSQNLMF